MKQFIVTLTDSLGNIGEFRQFNSGTFAEMAISLENAGFCVRTLEEIPCNANTDIAPVPWLTFPSQFRGVKNNF